MSVPNRPLTVTVKTSMKLSGLGLTTIYELIKQRKLETVKVGARRLIVYDTLEKLLLKGYAQAPIKRRGRPRKAAPAAQAEALDELALCGEHFEAKKGKREAPHGAGP